MILKSPNTERRAKNWIPANLKVASALKIIRLIIFQSTIVVYQTTSQSKTHFSAQLHPGSAIQWQAVSVVYHAKDTDMRPCVTC